MERAVRGLIVRRSVRVGPPGGRARRRGTKQHRVVGSGVERRRRRVFVPEENRGDLEHAADDGGRRLWSRNLAQRRDARDRRIELGESSRGPQLPTHRADGTGLRAPDAILPEIESGAFPATVSLVLALRSARHKRTQQASTLKETN